MGLLDTAADILDEMNDEDSRTDTNNDSSKTVAASARCMYSEDPFVIQFEKRGNAWAAINTSIPGGGGGNASTADTKRVSGPFEFPLQYDGCPHCSNTGLFLCGDCDNLACWDGDTDPVVCPWCASENPMGGGDIDSIDATEQSTSNDRSSSNTVNDRSTTETSSDRSTADSTSNDLTSDVTSDRSTTDTTSDRSTSVQRDK